MGGGGGHAQPSFFDSTAKSVFASARATTSHSSSPVFALQRRNRFFARTPATPPSATFKSATVAAGACACSACEGCATFGGLVVVLLGGDWVEEGSGGPRGLGWAW